MLIHPSGLLLYGHELDRRLVNSSHNVLHLGDDPYILLDMWITIYSVGQVALLLLICTLWKMRQARSWKGLTLINLLFTIFLTAIINCILWYAGEEGNGSPPIGLCLAQATLKHGSDMMTVVALLSLGIESFLSTRATIVSGQRSTMATILLLGAPYASFLTWSIPIAIMGVQHPENVERLVQTFYCSYNNILFGDINTISGVLVLFATAVMQTYTARILHCSWRATREIRAAGGIDLSLIVRICVIVALQIVFAILSVIDIDHQPTSVRLALGQFNTTYAALVPIYAFLIFGLRASVLEVWFGRWWNPSFFAPWTKSWIINTAILHDSKAIFEQLAYGDSNGSHGSWRAGSNASVTTASVAESELRPERMSADRENGVSGLV